MAYISIVLLFLLLPDLGVQLHVVFFLSSHFMNFYAKAVVQPNDFDRVKIEKWPATYFT